MESWLAIVMKEYQDAAYELDCSTKRWKAAAAELEAAGLEQDRAAKLYHEAERSLHQTISGADPRRAITAKA